MRARLSRAFRKYFLEFLMNTNFKVSKTALAVAIAAFAASAAMAADKTPANKLEINAGETVSISTNWGKGETAGVESWKINGGELAVTDSVLGHVGSTVPQKGASALEVNEGTVNVTTTKSGSKASIEVGALKLTGGTVNVTGFSYGDNADYRAAIGGYDSVTMTGGTVNVNKFGLLWVSSDLANDGSATMELGGGVVNVQGGTIAAGDGDSNDLLKLSGSTINVLKVADDKSGTNQIRGNRILQDGSDVNVAEGASVTIDSLLTNQESNKPNYLLKSGTFNIAKDATATFKMDVDVAGGEVVNNGGKFVSTGALTLRDGGKFTSALNSKTFAARTINLEDGGILNMTELNSELEGGAVLISGQGKNALNVDLAGGEIRVGDQLYTGQFKIGEKTDVGVVTISSGAYEASKIWFGSAEGNKLTIDNGADLTVGTLDATHGSTTVNGDLVANTIQLGAAPASTDAATPAVQSETSHFDIDENGYVYAENFVVNTAYTHDAGELEIVNLQVADGQKFSMTGGDLITDSTQLLKEDGKASKDTVSVTDGHVYLTDSGEGYTIKDWKAMRDAIYGTSAQDKQITFLDRNIIAKDAEGNITHAALPDVVEAGIQDVDRDTLTFTYDSTHKQAGGGLKDTGDRLSFGALELSAADGFTDAYKIGAGTNGEMTIRGNEAGEVFTGLEDKTLVIVGNTNFGDESDDAGTVNHTLNIQGQTEVKGTFTFANGVVVEDQSGTKLTVTGNSTLIVENGLDFHAVNGQKNNEVVEVKGDMQVDWMTDKAGVVNINGGTFALEGNKPADSQAPALTSATPFSGAVQLGMTKLTVGVFGIGADLASTKAAVAQYFDEDELSGKKVIYFAKQASQVGDGFDAKGMDLIVDVAGVAATDGFTAEDGMTDGTNVTFDGTTTVHLMNMTKTALEGKAGSKTFRLVQSVESSSSGAKVDYGTMFYGNEFRTTSDEEENLVSLTGIGALTDGVVSFAPRKDVLSLFDGSFFANRLNNAVAEVDFSDDFINKIVFGLDDYVVQVYNEGRAAGVEDLRQYVLDRIDGLTDSVELAQNMAVASGAFSTAVDINNEVWKALDRRMTLANLNAPRAAYGVTPWVDVIGTTNEAKDLFGGAGYEADIYGAVLGADWTAPCGAIVGLAFSVGQADGNSVGFDSKVDNDADFYGISLYGSHQIGNVNGKIDIGYLKVKNELSTNTQIAKFDEDLDAGIFTMGLGAEYLVKAGSLNVVPHAGIRWSRIDMDDSKYGADYDAMNLFQMPMGVTFSGTFDMTGWKVAPMLDLSVVPAFGDKDAVANIDGIEDTTRVVDTNPIQMTLGVNAQVDAWTFGVNYGLTAGGDERLNNSFNLNARYTF